MLPSLAIPRKRVCCDPRRGSSRAGPSGARRPRPPHARSVRSLVYRGPRLPAPSSRRDHAGQSSSSCRRAELVWGSSGCGGGGGERAARLPVCAVPPLTPRVVVGRRGGDGGGGLPVPPASPSSRAVRRVRPLGPRAFTSCAPPATGRTPRVWCVSCVLSGRAVVASLPLPRQCSHDRGKSRDLLPLLGVREGPCLAGLDRTLGGGRFWGNGGWPRPARRRTSGSAAARGSLAVGVSVSVSVSLVLVSPGAPGDPSVLGRLGAVGVVAGLLGECAV